MHRAVALLVLAVSPVAFAHYGRMEMQGGNWQQGNGGDWGQDNGQQWGQQMQGGNWQDANSGQHMHGGSWQQGNGRNWGQQNGQQWGQQVQGGNWQGGDSGQQMQGGDWQQGNGRNWGQQNGQLMQGGNWQGQQQQQQQQQVTSFDAQTAQVAQPNQLSLGGDSGSSATAGGASASAGSGQAQELPESVVYKDVNYEQYSAGYGAPPHNGGVERVDEPTQQLQDIVVNAQGQDTVADTTFPDANVNKRYDTTKEIHSSTMQRRITNQFNRNLRRYLKTLNVNALYNTNVQRVNHARLVNVLNVQSQDTHRPILRVAFNRQDTVTNLGDREDAPVVEQQASSNVLPPIVEAVQVNRVAYDGSSMPNGQGLRSDAGSQYTSEWGNQ